MAKQIQTPGGFHTTLAAEQAKSPAGYVQLAGGVNVKSDALPSGARLTGISGENVLQADA